MKKWILFLSGLIITCLLVFILALVGTAAIRKKTSQVSTPVVDVYSPHMDDIFLTNQPVMLQAVARDPDGVARIEFWLDEQLIKLETSPWEKGITPLPLAYTAHIDQPGTHWLVVRAVDTLGNSGQSSLRLNVTQSPDQPVSEPYVVQEGDTLEGIAEALGVPAEEITGENPGMEDELPPAGEEIILPLPEPEEEGDGAPAGEEGSEAPAPAEGAEIPPGIDMPPVDVELPPLGTPGITWDPDPGYPRWLYPFADLGRPLPIPAGLLDIALLEVNAAYDGVFCYVSAGESPVIRAPSTGFLSHLSGNFWDISEWFSGDRMLPFISSTGSLRLRMNCVGYYSTAGGGIVYDLGTLDITRSITEVGSGLIDERASRGSDWFRVQFRVQPLRSPGETGFDYLYLDSVRYARDEIALVPDPHAVLQFRIYDEGRHVAPPVMDGFLIYRNGALWRTTGPNTEHYVVWDHIREAGGCGQQTEFFVVGYRGNPLSPSATLESPHILINGYCPPDEQFYRVTVTFSWLAVFCMENAELWTLPTLDVTGSDFVVCGKPGEPDCILEDVLDTTGCPSALDNFSPVSYGGLLVNGLKVINMDHMIQFTPRYYNLLLGAWRDTNPYTITLEPGESLTVATGLWDYDVLWDDDPLCPVTLIYSPEDLFAIYVSGRPFYKLVTMHNYESECAMQFKLEVEPFHAPPPTIVP